MSFFDKITSFFVSSADKCTKDEDDEDNNHAAKVKEEEDRYNEAKKKIKTTKNCKLKYPDQSEQTPSTETKQEDLPIFKQQEQNGVQQNGVQQNGGKKSKRNRKIKRNKTKRTR
jgi:hypothetical protein